MRLSHPKRGVAAVLVVILMIPLLFLLAFSVDYGYLLYVETNLQRAADQAALAGVRDLVPDENGNQDLEKARATVKAYIQHNFGSQFEMIEADIEFGRYDPDQIYSELVLLEDGIFDSVRITVRRNDSANRSVALYFARLFGRDESGVVASSAAVLQKARFIGPGSGVFPFAISEQAWRRIPEGDVLSIYGDGRLEDEFGNAIPGNWGTVDIGPASNSTNDLGQQILNGLESNDLVALYRQRRIPTMDYIDASKKVWLNGDTGLSGGLKHPLADVQDQFRIAPVFKRTTGKGGNLEFEIVSWTVVQIVDSNIKGNGSQSYVNVRKSYTYDEYLRPILDLSDDTGAIENAFTSPVLVF